MAVLVALALGLSGVLAPGSALAVVQSPQWTVTGLSAPTNLAPGVATDEVQELTVSATGGEFVLVDETQGFNYRFFKWDATHEEVQAGLEEIYGTGDVEVSGGPGDEEGTKPYKITFTGGLAYQRVAPINAAYSVYYLSCEGATGSGCRQEAKITENAKGRPSGELVLTAQNTGGTSAHGETETITLTDVLPPGLKAASGASGADLLSGSTNMSCSGVSCTYSGAVPTDDYLELELPVVVEAGAPASVTDRVSVSGGGASEAAREIPIAIGSTPAGFAVAPGSTATALSSFQAGTHADLTASLAFTLGEEEAAGYPKEVAADLPPGFVGDLADTPRCPIAVFAREVKRGGAGGAWACPLSSQVGVVTVYVVEFEGVRSDAFTVPVFNLSTNPGEVAKLGFDIFQTLVEASISLRPGDYGVRTTFQNIQDTFLPLSGSRLTVWGVPSEESHDAMRGLACSSFLATHSHSCEYANNKEGNLTSPQPSTSPAIPYLTSPTQCIAEPLQAKLIASSWQEPDRQVSATSPVGPLTGCSLLEFPPTITAAPDTTHADTPAGFTFDLKMGQEGLLDPTGLSSADVENTKVTLPPGVVINPGQAAGLGVCQPSQAALGVQGPPSCPSSSRVGHVEVRTPLLKEKLEGEVYLLQSNPPNLELLVAPEDRQDGIYIKLVGEVHLDEATGQLVTTFKHTPQLPFSDFELKFSGGAQAALATPTMCGVYTTNGVFTPWSGEQDALLNSSFAIETGPGGSPCASPLPFAPSLIAGATSDQAGGFTNFSMLLQRADAQQRISVLQFTTPEGLLGLISKVQQCQAAQAASDTCPEASQIGHTVVEAGPGPYPLVVPQPGQPPAPIYLTGPYEGAPYGLLVKVPLLVGPFDLGTEVVRARIEVDPVTTQLTITTDPLPPIVKGVPTDLRTINAVIDRPQFMFNPTNCAPMSFSGTAKSTEGATAPIATRFQVGSCRSLEFKPRFVAKTSGRTSRANGASLDVKLSYPKDAFTKDANIAKVKVNLPKQLPSRLTTLQKACPDTIFAADPGACPPASRVGSATATTPILAGALTGPAYFVSHGGAKFPELIIALQGDGVTVDLHGETFISKAGITSSTFRQIPDVPVNTFELKLPQGKDSALAANGKLCRSRLRMPTAFTAQNGLVIHQSTPIHVTGCPTHKTHTARRARRRRRRG